MDENFSEQHQPPRFDEKRLIIIRHGKAAYPPGVPDHERPLAARGNREAPLAGRWLVDHDLIPDQIISSSALRTRQTTAWILAELGEKAPTPYLETGLYLTPATEVLSIINQVEETVRTLLLVGHMPWVQDLGMRLASVDSEEGPVLRMAEHYPTLGIQVFSVLGEWATLDGRDARMLDFVVPRPESN